MKRILLGLCLGIVAWGVAGGAAALENGRDYETLAKPQPVDTGAKIEVREFFWYGCPHCYALEPSLDRWLKRLPANVEFIRTPATAPRWMVHAQAYYAFAALDATAKTHAALFRAIHEDNRRLDNETALAEFAKERGIDPAKFRAAFESFGVRFKLQKAKQINEAFQVTSVPTFGVDGKFITSASMAGGEQQLFAVLDQLIQKAARERGAKAAGR
jgi:protein dithiol oxidoreductase (disulfide-forming)